ncbi:Hypothetical protein A7982_08138 [Minicystis rosea]|nr:Hypothetical protein A7982_08138 [Minicystis rosea]
MANKANATVHCDDKERRGIVDDDVAKELQKAAGDYDPEIRILENRLAAAQAEVEKAQAALERAQADLARSKHLWVKLDADGKAIPVTSVFADYLYRKFEHQSNRGMLD